MFKKILFLFALCVIFGSTQAAVAGAGSGKQPKAHKLRPGMWEQEVAAYKACQEKSAKEAAEAAKLEPKVAKTIASIQSKLETMGSIDEDERVKLLENLKTQILSNRKLYNTLISFDSIISEIDKQCLAALIQTLTDAALIVEETRRNHRAYVADILGRHARGLPLYDVEPWG